MSCSAGENCEKVATTQPRHYWTRNYAKAHMLLEVDGNGKQYCGTRAAYSFSSICDMP